MHEPVCYLAEHGELTKGVLRVPMTPCSGDLIRAHLLPRQLLLRELDPIRAAAAVEDPRSWVPACGGPMGNGGHHGLFDQGRRLYLPREDLPEGVEELAAELGLGWWLEREYGRLEV